MRWFVAVLFASFALLRVSSAWACAVCGAADKALPASGNEIPFAGRTRGILEGRGAAFATTARDVRVQELRAEATTSTAISDATMLGVTAPLLLRAVTSSVDPAQAPLGLGGSSEARVDRAMPGDVELRAAHTAFRSRPAPVTRRLTLSALLKLPTAPLERDAAGRALMPDLQPGCGSMVPGFGGTYAWSASLWSAWTSASFIMPLSVRDGPHPGASLRGSTTLQLQPTTKLATRLGVLARYDGAGAIDGEVIPRSGGAAVYLAPEIVVSPVTDLVMSIGASFPAVQAMRGYRSTSPVLFASVALDL